MDFREFMEQDSMTPPTTSPGQGPKPWKAKKADVINFWQQIRPGMPLDVQPVEKGHLGTRFSEDGIRITGSPSFINSVLSRLKDFLQYNSTPGMKLDVEYREVQGKSGGDPGKKVYVFYVHVLQDQPEAPKPEVPKLT